MEASNEKKEKKSAGKSTKSAAIVGGVLLAVIAILGAVFLLLTRDQIYTDKADIEAPSITISTPQGGTIEKILVTDGENVSASTPVAQISGQVLYANEAGEVIDAQHEVGKTVTPGEAVVTIIDPDDLRVVAHVDEDKGLSRIQVGQLVNFTVDAFGSQKFTGIVDQIVPSARQSGVVFNISDQREVRQFDVKIRYDVTKYPQLKNGMSAKVTIFTK